MTKAEVQLWGSERIVGPRNCGTGYRLGKQMMRKSAESIGRQSGAGVVVRAFSPALRRQKWVDLYESEV